MWLCCRARLLLAAQGQNAVFAARERGGVRPEESGACGGLESGEIGLGGEKRQPAVGADEMRGRLDCSVHVVDGAKGYAVELGGEGFGAGGVDFGGDAGDADGFVEEGGFFALRLGEDDGYLWAADGDGDAGEACSRAEVEEGGDAGGEGLGAGDGLDEMARKDGFGITDGG